jgi:hypothetical protein
LEEKFDKFELEERINKLEEQQKNNISILQISSIQVNKHDCFGGGVVGGNKWLFCNINSSCIKITNQYLYLDDLQMIDFCKDSIPPNFVTFISQLQNIKIIEFEAVNQPSFSDGSSDGSGENILYKHQYLLINELLINSTHKFDIIFKTTKLYDIPPSSRFELFEIFMKSTNYKKLHIEVKNNLVVSGTNAHYVSQPYVNETKEYCIRNNIEFTSNIGL